MALEGVGLGTAIEGIVWTTKIIKPGLSRIFKTEKPEPKTKTGEPFTVKDQPDSAKEKTISENLQTIFQKAIYEIAFIHNLEISLYDLKGNILITSVPFGLKDSIPKNLSTLKVSQLKSSTNSRVFEIIEFNKINIETSYTYILDALSNRIGILKLEFNQDNTAQEYELKEFLTRLIIVYFFMFLNKVKVLTCQDYI